MLTRRLFGSGLLALAAPAIIRTPGLLMPVSSLTELGDAPLWCGVRANDVINSPADFVINFTAHEMRLRPGSGSYNIYNTAPHDLLVSTSYGHREVIPRGGRSLIHG